MNEQIARRIVRELEMPELVEVLSERLSGSDLSSLLLAVLKRRVSKIDRSRIMIASPATEACNLDGRLLNKLENTAYEIAPQFEAIDLSPLCPLGVVATLTGLDQGNVLSTVRSFECASDPTIGLALECARRRKKQSNRKDVDRLCSNHRVVRFPLPDNPAFSAHFKLFCLISAGRDIGSGQFERDAIKEHIRVYLSFLSKLGETDFAFEDIVVELSDTRVVSHFCSIFDVNREEVRANVRARDSNSSDSLLAKYSATWPKYVVSPKEDLAKFDLPKHLITHLDLVEQTVCEPIRKEHSGVQFKFNLHRLTGLGYYQGPCFHIKTKNSCGQEYMLADGGFVDWTQVLLSDEKERLMTSAIGIELICRMFRRA
jgi:hypothetical protein